MSSQATNSISINRSARDKKSWLFAFAIAGLVGPALLTAFGAIVSPLHLAAKYPNLVRISATGLAKLWFSLFLLQGAHSQRDLAIWWLPCVAINVGMYYTLGYMIWQSWRLFLRGPKLFTAVLLGGCVGLGLVSCLLGWWGPPILWHFPAGYRGWVVVQYGDSNCPPLATKGLYKVIVVDGRGRSCTSSRMPAGLRYLRFEYIDTSGAEQTLLSGWFQFLQVHSPQVSTQGIVQNLGRQMLFVGTDEERKQRMGEFPWLTP
jgi:hypothetical protein